MAGEVLAARAFDAADQTWFAALSGDHNPMHVDAVAARRTQAGAPVVHGMHTLLWCLDALAKARPGLPAIASLKLRADQMIYLGDRVEAILLQESATSLRAEVRIGDAVACRLALGFGAPVAAAASPEGGVLYAPERPEALDLAAMEQMQGRIGFATSADAAARAFPAAAAMLGGQRVAALACMTRLVGMLCPGLHSIFGGVDLKLAEAMGERTDIAFAVHSLDRRFRMVRMNVAGAGLQGRVDSFARMPPSTQPGMAEIAAMVDGGVFAGAVVLVVGGSRGLGEVTAKIAAAGGARVIISYASGRDDAMRVAGEIRTFGSVCDIVHFDALMPAAGQLANLPASPSHLYYFATPHIGRRKRPLFDPDRFDQFLRFYVTGFFELCQYLQAAGSLGSVFYPSSVFVDERPAELTEYAMAKAAGELLCRDMAIALAPLQVHCVRLPRIDTDQNASVTEISTERGLDVMLPLVFATQG